MNKKFVLALALTAAACGAFAQANDTLAKAKAAGKVVMGVRESSAPCRTPPAAASSPATTWNCASAS